MTDLVSLEADPGLAGPLEAGGDFRSFLDDGNTGGLPVNIWSKLTLLILYFSCADFCWRFKYNESMRTEWRKWINTFIGNQNY